MSRWPTVVLGEVLTQYREYIDAPEALEYPKLSVKLYGKGVVLDTPVDGASLKMKRHQLAKPGQVILSEIWGKKGAIGIVPPEGGGALCTSHFFLFDIDTTKLEPAWLEAIFIANYLEPQLEERAFGTTGYASVRPQDLVELEIPLPPIEEQRRIVEKLDRLANGVQRVSRLQAHAREESHHLAMSAVTTQLRTWAAEGNRMEPLGALADVRAGVTLGRKLSGPTETLPYLRVANVQAGHLDFGVVKEISILPEEEPKWALERGDLLLTEGGDWDKLGRGAVWQAEIPRCIHQNHIYRLRMTDERFDVRYIFLLTQSQYGRDYFSAASKQTTNLASINQRQLKAFPVPAVSMANQYRLVKQWESLSRLAEGLTTRQDQAQQTAEVVLASAMHSEFGGETL